MPSRAMLIIVSFKKFLMKVNISLLPVVLSDERVRLRPWSQKERSTALTEQQFCETAYGYRALLYHVAYTILRDNRECEDAVQEALMKAWQKRDTLRNEEAFRFWLTRILTNTCHTLLRKKRRAQTTELTEDMPAPFDDGLNNRALHDAIGRLSQDLRLPIVLHYLEGFSIKEIAVLTHRPTGTIQNRLFRAREALRSDLGEEIDV